MKIYEHPRGLLIEFDKELLKKRKKRLATNENPFDGGESYEELKILEDYMNGLVKLLGSPSRRYLSY